MRVLAFMLALLSAFFLFYTMRLFAVTHFLQQTRAGGDGAYVGGIIFPLLALAFGWESVRCWRRA